MNVLERSLLALMLVASPSLAVPGPARDSNDRIQVRLDTEEAEDVLAIAAKQSRGQAIATGEWQRLFACEPHVRLK